MRSMMHIKW